jgi:single-strand DNA-binding protein
MAQGFHSTEVIGNLGADPVLRYTTGGQAVTSFSVAADRRFTTSDGKTVDETTWFNISVWGRQAEPCSKYLKKGRQVFIKGRLVSDRATGGPRTFPRQNGETGAKFELNADLVQFLGSNGNKEEIPAEPAPEEEPAV